MNKEVDPLVLVGAGGVVLLIIVFFAWRAFAPDHRAQVSTNQMAQHQTQAFNPQAGIAKTSWVNGKEVNVHFH